MVFSTSSFLFLFLPAVVLGYYLLTLMSKKTANFYLFAVSMVFYCWNDTRYAVLLLFSIALNYVSSILLYRICRQRERHLIFLCSLAINIGLLCYYKYTGFLLKNLSLLLNKQFTIPDIILPIGISFYTFQAMSYLIDVYHGGEPLRNPFDLGMYITFFPQLIAGPIVRYGQIQSCIHDRRVCFSDFADGMTRFLTGFCKKVILANNLGALADIVFNGKSPGSYSVLMLWLSAASYTLQIYYDFSGYSDMAIGLGRMFGFRFPENFQYPYSASTITDFWRRWHMTLSGWFRDYVYIPLGGSRKGNRRHILNLLLVWALTGLWHGAAWQFLFWGLSYFVLLITEKYVIHPERFRSFPARFAYRFFTLIVVCLLWVVFRARDFPNALLMIAAMFGYGNSRFFDAFSLFYLREYAFYLFTGVLFMTPVFASFRKEHTSWYFRSQAVLLFLGTLLSIAFILKDSYNPFLYFQF